MKYIGYYNHNPYPVQFSLRSGRSAPIFLDAGQPIVRSGTNQLIAYPQDELEEEVKLGTISRIRDDDKRFQKWNQQAAQAATVVHVERDDEGFPVDRTPTSAVNQVPANRIPDVTVSAGGGVQATAEVERQTAEAKRAVAESSKGQPFDNLDAWIEQQQKDPNSTLKVLPGGRFEFNGQPFANKKALGKFLSMSQS
jgi:hypothetical protein